ncbi:MAG: molybdate ABC transporter substrate-binding protein [Actinomycetota bacterium]|nr:molybdate ABC transporter substrate-binding protein [Actinomycetota bacterium]
MKFGRRFHPALMTALIISSIAGVVGAAGCGGSGGGAADRGSDGGTLTVFAASSLTDAFGELEKRFEEQYPAVDVRQSFESSSTLLTQIQQGAPADVFASAAREEMRTAARDGLVAGEPEIFVRNRELIMVPKENPANIESMHDLSKPGIKLVLAEDGVPAADYAREIVDEASAEYGSGFREDVLSNVVSREADVRASVSRVALGDADATFGYASDYTPDIRDRVRVIRIPENLNRSAIYPIAVLEEAREPELAREWVDLVVSSEGQRVLEKWGFRSAA